MIKFEYSIKDFDKEESYIIFKDTRYKSENYNEKRYYYTTSNFNGSKNFIYLSKKEFINMLKKAEHIGVFYRKFLGWYGSKDYQEKYKNLSDKVAR